MPVDPTIALSLIEVAKSLIQGYFTLMRQAGKTEEEIDLIYDAEKEKFEQNKPGDLPDV